MHVHDDSNCLTLKKKLAIEENEKKTTETAQGGFGEMESNDVLLAIFPEISRTHN